jgi:hypothetical protein
VQLSQFLNTIVASGLPNHKLRLKVGVPVMLLRNLDQHYGLCNGTRLIITRMEKFVLEGGVMLETKYIYLDYLYHLQTSEFLLSFKEGNFLLRCHLR